MIKKFCFFALIFLFANLYSLQKFIVRTANPQKEITLLVKPTKNTVTPPEKETVRTLSIPLKHGEKIDVIFFDWNKNKIIIVGQGFPGIKEYGKSIARLFHDYDVLLFDYRWKNLWKFIFQFSTLFHPIDAFFFREKEVVASIINFVNKQKTYSQVIGLGECYSNFTFVLAQAESEEKKNPLFTKLILDSCWYNSRDFVEEISFDPWLPFDPQQGGAPEWLKSILQSSLIHFPISCLLDLFTPNISIKPYLSKISSPFLFIHGQNDKMVPLKKVFEKIWTILTAEKALLITPFEHSDNMQNYSVYKTVCDRFIKAKPNKVGQDLALKLLF